MQTLPTVLDPLFIQHEGIAADEVRELIGTEPRRAPEHGPLVLMRAVLRDAILCLQGQAPDVPRSDRMRLAEEARVWVLSRDFSYLFSFEAICDVLGLDAEDLRRRLRLMPSRALQTPDGPDGSERRDMVRHLRRARMRGNQRTHVVQPRRRRAETQAVA